MESLAKKIILFSIIGVISYAAIIFVSNKREVKERSNNSLVNQSINNVDYKNTARIKTLMKSIDETYNSTNTIKLLYANELLEEGSFDKSIEILDSISNTKSVVTNELVYSLKAKAFASKGLCSVSESYSKKITQHISIKEISNIHVSNCKNE